MHTHANRQAHASARANTKDAASSPGVRQGMNGSVRGPRRARFPVVPTRAPVGPAAEAVSDAATAPRTHPDRSGLHRARACICKSRDEVPNQRAEQQPLRRRQRASVSCECMLCFPVVVEQNRGFLPQPRQANAVPAEQVRAGTEQRHTKQTTTDHGAMLVACDTDRAAVTPTAASPQHTSSAIRDEPKSQPRPRAKYTGD